MYSRKCLRRLCGRRRSKKNLNNRKLCNTSSSSSSSFLRDPRDPSRLTLKRSGAAITIGRFSFRVLRFVFYASNLVLLISLSLSLSLSQSLWISLSLSLSLTHFLNIFSHPLRGTGYQRRTQGMFVVYTWRTGKCVWLEVSLSWDDVKGISCRSYGSSWTRGNKEKCTERSGRWFCKIHAVSYTHLTLPTTPYV